MQVRIVQVMNRKRKLEVPQGDVVNEENLAATMLAEKKSKKVVRDKVKKLVKQNKLRRVDSILKHASTDEPWSTVVHVKV